MDRMTISEVKALRTLSHTSPAPALSYKQYDAYKSARSLNKPQSKICQRYLSRESRQFSGASLKKMATPNPGSVIIPLGTGRPNAEFFPWESLVIQNEKFADAQPWSINGGAAHKVPKRDGIYDLSSVLDYGYAAGSPQLLRFVTEHVELVHDPPYSDWGVCLSAGSTSALEIAMRIFCNRDDTILAEHLTYPGFLEAAELLGVKVCGLEMDAEGITPESLSRTLRDWNPVDGRKPSVLYTIPSGHNPTGVSQTYERKLELYTIAEEHDLIIIEDDPYYYLQLSFCKSSAGNGQDFLKSLIPTYVSIDTSGRVVRLDSTSKIIAPGLRAGWVTANDCIIDKFLSYHEVSTAFVNGPSQLMLYKLLEESWGHLGFLNWLADLSSRYRQRREIMVQACQAHLPREFCDWVVPPNGLYLWIDVDMTKYPKRSLALDDQELHQSVEEKILGDAMTKGVQVTPGSMFQVSDRSDNKIGFRFTFATADESDLATGVRFFAEAVRDVFNGTH